MFPLKASEAIKPGILHDRAAENISCYFQVSVKIRPF